MGETFKAFTSPIVVDGFTSADVINRFSLGRFTNTHRTRAVERVRNRIGEGILLEKSGGSVVLTNNSRRTVFMYSAIANMIAARERLHVVRVPAGGNALAYRFDNFLQLIPGCMSKGFIATDNLKHLCSITVSFQKGWGEGYKCKRAPEVPCWIQVSLSWPQTQLDYILRTMNPDALQKPTSSSI